MGKHGLEKMYRQKSIIVIKSKTEVKLLEVEVKRNLEWNPVNEKEKDGIFEYRTAHLQRSLELLCKGIPTVH